jgi:hypothetical protein
LVQGLLGTRRVVNVHDHSVHPLITPSKHSFQKPLDTCSLQSTSLIHLIFFVPFYSSAHTNPGDLITYLLSTRINSDVTNKRATSSGDQFQRPPGSC